MNNIIQAIATFTRVVIVIVDANAASALNVVFNTAMTAIASIVAADFLSAATAKAIAAIIVVNFATNILDITSSTTAVVFAAQIKCVFSYGEIILLLIEKYFVTNYLYQW